MQSRSVKKREFMRSTFVKLPPALPFDLLDRATALVHHMKAGS
jgi:hypothetical protein